MSLYYREELHVHEHRPTVSDGHKYLDKERQWLLLESKKKNIAFLRYYFLITSLILRIKHMHHCSSPPVNLYNWLTPLGSPGIITLQH